MPRKVTRAVARNAAGLQNKVYLGNLNAIRDWGYAPEYVEGMWRMLQADQPSDYVLATGHAMTVREFCQAAFRPGWISTLRWSTPMCVGRHVAHPNAGGPTGILQGTETSEPGVYMLEQFSRVLPKAVRRQLRRFRMRSEWRRLGTMTREAAFNDVYVRGLWGSESEGLSGRGSYGDFAEHYVEIVEDLVQKVSAASVLDIGTGDFNIGQKLCHLVEQFIAADVSSVIVERNRALFAAERTVNFIQLDACSDPLPRADLVLIRQVLQHLSNDEIEAILTNLERSDCRRALIVEHHPASTEFKQENMDLPAHGPHLRIADGSGVYLDRPPFSRKAETVATCQCGRGETLTYYLWECGTQSV